MDKTKNWTKNWTKCTKITLEKLDKMDRNKLVKMDKRGKTKVAGQNWTKQNIGQN